MPPFDELRPYCSESFDQGCSLIYRLSKKMEHKRNLDFPGLLSLTKKIALVTPYVFISALSTQTSFFNHNTRSQSRKLRKTS